MSGCFEACSGLVPGHDLVQWFSRSGPQTGSISRLGFLEMQMLIPSSGMGPSMRRAGAW